jgi:hypothetical protein
VHSMTTTAAVQRGDQSNEEPLQVHVQEAYNALAKLSASAKRLSTSVAQACANTSAKPPGSLLLVQSVWFQSPAGWRPSMGVHGSGTDCCQLSTELHGAPWPELRVQVASPAPSSCGPSPPRPNHLPQRLVARGTHACPQACVLLKQDCALGFRGTSSPDPILQHCCRLARARTRTKHLGSGTP